MRIESMFRLPMRSRSTFNRRRAVTWLGIAALGCMAVAGPQSGMAQSGIAQQSSLSQASVADSTKSSEEYYELLRLFVDTLDQVERNYVKDVTRRQLIEAAIEGMLSKLDKHSDYISPDDLDRFKTDVESEFGGVGIQVSGTRDQPLTVISPLVGSPAYRAGVLAGDVITHIEGEPTKGYTVDDAIKRIKGPVGTSVKITVRHRVSRESQEVDLAREIIRVDTVRGVRRQDDDSWDFFYDHESKIGYLRITGFARHTKQEMSQALRRLVNDGMAGLILDLRYNPGGLLSSAIRISDLFVSSGRIVSTEGRNRNPQVWDARKGGTYEGFPMAVLVNRFSASASEIVAACLQDHGRAIVVGERTFGKGSVQNIVELEGGRSALKLTTAGYLRPSGKNIHRSPGATGEDEWGVRPDAGYEVSVSFAGHDRLQRHLAAREIVGVPSEPTESDGEEPAEAFVDNAFEKAVEYLTGELADSAGETIAAGDG